MAVLWGSICEYADSGDSEVRRMRINFRITNSEIRWLNFPLEKTLKRTLSKNNKKSSFAFYSMFFHLSNY